MPEATGDDVERICEWAKKKDWRKIEEFLTSSSDQEMNVKYVLAKGIDPNFWQGSDPNLFQWALAKYAPLAFIEYLLVGMGGKEGGEKIMAGKDKNGVNGMFYAFHHFGNKTSSIELDTLRLMVHIGGDKLISADVYGNNEKNILYFICRTENPTVEMIDLAMGYDPGSELSKNPEERDENALKLLNNTRSNGKLPIDLLLRKSGRTPVPLDAVAHLQKIWYYLDPYLRDFPEDGMSKTLQTIQNKSNNEIDAILEGEYFRAVLNKIAIDPLTIWVMLFDLVMQLFVVAAFSFLMKKEENIPELAITLLTMSTIWIFVRELLQLWSLTFYQYMNDASNLFDLAQLALLFQTLLVHEKVDQTLLIVSIMVAWFRLVFVFGNMFYSISVFVSALIQIARKLVPFLFVTIILVMAFSHSFHALGPLKGHCPLNAINGTIWEERDWTCSLGNSYFESAVMFFGGDWVYLDSYEGAHSWLSMIFAFIVGILLLNIIIALISNAFTEIEGNSAKAFWVNRLNFVIGLDIIKSMFTPLTKVLDFCQGPLEKWRGALPEERAGHIRYVDVYTNQIDPRYKELYLDVDIDKALLSALDWFYCVPTKDAQGNCVYSVITKKEDGAWGVKTDKEGAKCPSPVQRIVFIFSVLQWQEILPPSKECRKILVGKSYPEDFVIKGDPSDDKSKESHDYYLILGSYLAGLFFFLFSIIGLLVAFSLGLVTGGYFWPKEIKRYLFCADIEDKIGETAKIVTLEADKIRMELIESQKHNRTEIVKESKENMMEVMASKKKTTMEVGESEKKITKVEERMSNLEEKTDKILKLLQERPIEPVAWG